MPLALILIFGGVMAAYMGLNNVSFKGILSDQPSPISGTTPPSTGTSASAGGSAPVSGVPFSPLAGAGFKTGKPVGPNSTGIFTFSSAQQSFAKRLSADTGLNLQVVYAWMAAEQPPGSASAPNGQHNWLNIGSTDSGFYGGANPAWTNPITAADQTATWLMGGATYGYGTAASTIRSIIPSAKGQSPGVQLQAIRSSGWASSGYPLLAETYQEVLGN
jgi:hypothetical protein